MNAAALLAIVKGMEIIALGLQLAGPLKERFDAYLAVIRTKIENAEDFTDAELAILEIEGDELTAAIKAAVAAKPRP